ncbi:MAG: hypothetical protein ACXWW5_02895 [Actinomycetota bacterium]
MSSAQEGTVRNLQELYTVAAGIALVFAIERLVRVPTGADDAIRWSYLPAFLAFMVTLVPFYHGGMRHFDQVYVEEEGRNVRTGALLADFFLVFLEACLLLASARLLPDVTTTAWMLTTLFALDAIWGTTVYLVFTKGRLRLVELRWVLINIVTAALLAGFLIFAPADPVGGGVNVMVAVVLLCVTTVRTGIDYWVSWSFYFPWSRDDQVATLG